MKPSNEDLDKIKQLYNSNEQILALQLSKSLGLSSIEFVELCWSYKTNIINHNRFEITFNKKVTIRCWNYTFTRGMYNVKEYLYSNEEYGVKQYNTDELTDNQAMNKIASLIDYYDNLE